MKWRWWFKREVCVCVCVFVCVCMCARARVDSSVQSCVLMLFLFLTLFFFKERYDFLVFEKEGNLRMRLVKFGNKQNERILLLLLLFTVPLNLSLKYVIKSYQQCPLLRYWRKSYLFLWVPQVFGVTSCWPEHFSDRELELNNPLFTFFFFLDRHN